MTCTLVAMAIICSLTGPTLEGVPEGPFTAKVAGGVGGDAVKLTVLEKELLVGLYGVNCDKMTRSVIAQVHGYLKEQCGDIDVQVTPIKVISGLTYVEITLPNGNSLNKFILQKGFAELDTLSAGDDNEYKDLVSAVENSPKKQIASAQQESATETHPAKDPTQALADFKAKEYMKSVALLESEIEKWRALPNEHRQYIQNYYANMLNMGAAEYSRLVSARSQVVGENFQELNQNQSAISSRHTAVQLENLSEASTLASIYDDFDLNWNSEMRDSFQKDFIAETATGQEYSAQISGTLMNEYAYKAMLDSNRVGSQAAAASEIYQNRRKSHQNVINNLIVKQRSMENAAEQMQANHEYRFSEILARIDLLNEALLNDYEPVLSQTKVIRISDKSNKQFPPFKIMSKVWRIDWYLLPKDPRATFTADLYSVKNQKFVARVIPDRPPYQAFIICEDAGEFYLKVHTTGDVEYTFDVVELF
ncbi:MAG: hypothetical protein SGI88_06155 [Candidatus Hydrogenedentes bacterium]|nr:hypothetical protein [Candidatus Hydrogenedentota bacterium]